MHTHSYRAACENNRWLIYVDRIEAKILETAKPTNELSNFKNETLLKLILFNLFE